MADYYSEDEQAESMPDNEGEEKEDSGTETALLSKSMFGGHEIKVGDVCEFKVVAIHDDQAEIEYVTEGKEDESESGSTGNSMERMQAYADKP